MICFAIVFLRRELEVGLTLQQTPRREKGTKMELIYEIWREIFTYSTYS
jgi:hypothetical protein